MEEEVIWIRNIQRGETHDFQNLYHKHHRKLFSLCYRFTRDIRDAEEQLQEIFMRLLRKIKQYRGDASFSTWAHRLAVNHLINFRKGHQKRDEMTSLGEMDQERGAEHDPDLALMLEAAVDALPEGYRKVFILHDQEGFSHDEIGAILGCSPATSRSQLCRARVALREHLKPRLTKEVRS